jgi:hypothetical protein
MTETLLPCTVADPFDVGFERSPTGPLTACGELAIALVTVICVHEHADRALACAGCVTEFQQCADILICSRCEDGPEPHECPATLRIEWLEMST